MIKHYSEIEWDDERWPNFSPGEPNLACPCCGMFCMDEDYFDAIQNARTILGVPITINSGHRCAARNAHKDVGGAPNSEHLRIAFDVDIPEQRTPFQVFCALWVSGFRSFGLYYGRIHADKRCRKFWTVGNYRKTWSREDEAVIKQTIRNGR